MGVAREDPYAGGGAGGESSLSVRGRTPRVRFQMMVGRSRTTYTRRPEQRFPARERGDGVSYVVYRICIEGRREQKGKSPLRRHDGAGCLTCRFQIAREVGLVDGSTAQIPNVQVAEGRRTRGAMSVERGGGLVVSAAFPRCGGLGGSRRVT